MKLYPHQKKALSETKQFNKVAYYLDMGLGKTFVGSEKMMELHADTNIVICQKSKIQDWIIHFAKNYYQIEIFDLTDKKRFDDFISHDTAWAGWRGCTKSIGIINYELAWRRKELLNVKNFTLMLDESSLIQNPTAKQSKFIWKQLNQNAANVILLSGTPTSGKYENLWTQIHLLGWEIPKKVYENQYVNWETLRLGEKFIRIPDRKNPYKNVERLKEKLREHGATFMKTEECFELPEQTFIEVNVSKSKEYDKFMKDSIVTLKCGCELIGDTTLNKLLYARQLCGQYNSSKLDAFKSLVESTNDRLIVFYNFKEEAKQLIHIANEFERPWAIISGAEKNLAAYENYDNSITFVQYQAGAMGLNLQKANKVVYFTLPLRSELFEQSKKRIHRIGQEEPCFYYIMKCGRTVEDKIYEMLKLRKDFTDELFRDF